MKLEANLHLDPEQLRELARLVAEELRAAGAGGAGEFYSPEDNPLGSRRAFLEAARRGDFPSFKPDRRRTLARREDVDRWIASTQRPQPAPKPANDGDEAYLAQLREPRRHRRAG
jgi:hypothetical protein